MAGRSGGRLVLCGEILDEPSFSLFARILAAASAVLLPTVEDDPGGTSVVTGWPEPKSGWQSLTRHRSTMFLTSAKVVMSLPAILQRRKRPLSASRRRLAFVIEPSGNASFAATSNRSGVSSVTSSRLSSRWLIVAWNSYRFAGQNAGLICVGLIPLLTVRACEEVLQLREVKRSLSHALEL